MKGKVELLGGALVLAAAVLAATGNLQAAFVALLGVPVAAALAGFIGGIQSVRREVREGLHSYENEGREQAVSLHSVPRTDPSGTEVPPLDSVQIDDPPAPRLVRLPSPDGAE